MLFDNDFMKIAMKPDKILKETPVGCSGEGERRKGNIREGSRESRPGSFL